VKLRNVLFGILTCVIASITRRMQAIISKVYDDCRWCIHNKKYRNIRESIVFSGRVDYVQTLISIMMRGFLFKSKNNIYCLIMVS